MVLLDEICDPDSIKCQLNGVMLWCFSCCNNMYYLSLCVCVYPTDLNDRLKDKICES